MSSFFPALAFVKQNLFDDPVFKFETEPFWLSSSLWTGSLFGKKSARKGKGKGGGGGGERAFSLFPLPSSPLDQRPVHRLTLLLGLFAVDDGDHFAVEVLRSILGTICGTVNHSLWTLTLFLSADYIEQKKSHVLLEVIDINVHRYINLTKSTREASFKFLTLQSE